MRAFRAQRGGSCLLLSLHYNLLPQCLEDRTLSGLLMAKLLVVGCPIVLIVLPIIIIISSLNIFQGYGTPILRALIFFFQPLRGKNCLLVPPVGIVQRVLHYLKCQHAVGTLVVPLWPPAHF